MPTKTFLISSRAEIVCHTNPRCPAVRQIDRIVRARIAVDDDGEPTDVGAVLCERCDQ